ncbi:MAG: nitroreductase [Proteobacteria bacterium]|nr:nitroreductase [Pseudomonadota bacterium]
MELVSAIQQRRSVFKFTDQPVGLADIMPLLSLAVLAPNHRLTQPWQFLWVGPQTQQVLSAYYAEAKALKKVDRAHPTFADYYQSAQQRFMETPAILMVACRVNDDPVIAEEDFAATCCAVQNFLLAVTDKGLGAQWSTHPIIRDKRVLDLLKLDAQKTRVVAMVYLGYPAVIPQEPPRRAESEFLTVLP